jgi:hypothetical protein
VGPYDAIVDGDSLVYTIACASVVAKVVRDRLMTRLAARHPGYGWERNAGYATAEHRAAMVALGVTPFHRRSFITTRRAIEGVEQLGFDLVAVGPGHAPGPADATDERSALGDDLLAAWEADADGAQVEVIPG